MTENKKHEPQEASVGGEAPKQPRTCVWCGESYAKHDDTEDPNRAVPRTPCLGLKSGYVGRQVIAPAPPPDKETRMFSLDAAAKRDNHNLCLECGRSKDHQAHAENFLLGHSFKQEPIECPECAHTASHGLNGCEYERGDRWIEEMRSEKPAPSSTEREEAAKRIAEAQRERDWLDGQLTAANVRVIELGRQIDKESAAHLVTIDSRDRFEEALSEAHIALGGDGEWVCKVPAETAPDSGDLAADVPVLAEQIKAERDSALLEAKGLREQL